MVKIKKLEIIFSNGQVKTIHSPIEYEFRNLDFGYPRYDETEIAKAREKNIALIYQHKGSFFTGYIPDDVELVIHQKLMVS